MLFVRINGKDRRVLNEHDMRLLEVTAAISAAINEAATETQRLADARQLVAAAQAGDKATVRRLTRRLK